MQQHGVATDFIWVSEESRTNVSVVMAGGGRYFKVNERGPKIAPAEQVALIDKVLSLATPDDWCVLCGSLPPNVPDGIYANLITQLQMKGTRVVLDTSGEALRLGCAASPYLVTPNSSEAIELTKELKPSVAAKLIYQLGPSHVVVTLGQDGAMLVDAQGVQVITPPTVDERNAIGAGDALVGGLVYSLEQGLSLDEALRWGVACGTVASSLEGTAFGDRTTIGCMLSQLIAGNSPDAPRIE